MRHAAVAPRFRGGRLDTLATKADLAELKADPIGRFVGVQTAFAAVIVAVVL